MRICISNFPAVYLHTACGSDYKCGRVQSANASTRNPSPPEDMAVQYVLLALLAWLKVEVRGQTELTLAEKENILRFHNYLRTTVVPLASNMEIMVKKKKRLHCYKQRSFKKIKIFIFLPSKVVE